MSELILGKGEEVLWNGYKRFLSFKNPFTKYTLTNRALYIESGVLRYSFDEIRLFRISDISIQKTIGERIFGTGSINIISADKSKPHIRVGSILEVGELKMLISEYVDAERERQGIRMSEFIK